MVRNHHVQTSQSKRPQQQLGKQIKKNNVNEVYLTLETREEIKQTNKQKTITQPMGKNWHSVTLYLKIPCKNEEGHME